jgi:DNA polymerase-3 subunit gamma/tau
MFEHIVGQNAINQLIVDHTAGTLAPSMLFTGPPASGKGTAGLELGRILSCKTPGAPPDCSCSACVRHKPLTHPDMLILGPRNFSSEISGAAAAFLREPASDTRLLFIRSVRKLLARFSPIIWEEDPKFSKLSDSIISLEEALEEIAASGISTPEDLKKRIDPIVKAALKLESGGISDLISIGHLRRSALWGHLAPMGKRKLLLIENADRMQEGARNSLLKILEEPPELLIIVLTTPREKALLPTVLSRVRPYRFVRRSQEDEAEVIRRVFKDTNSNGICAYLDSFLPVPEEKLRPLAAFFAMFIASGTALTLRRRGLGTLPAELMALGKYAAPIAESAGLGKPGKNAQSVIAKVMAGAEKFEIRGLFPQFLALLLALVSESWGELKRTGVQNSGANGYYDLWRKHIGDAAQGVGIYNQSPVSALERLNAELKRAMLEHCI